MPRSILQLRQLRLTQPSRSSNAAYAQMDRMKEAAQMASVRGENGVYSTPDAAKKTSLSLRK